MLIFLLLFANSTEIYFALAFAPGNQEWSVSFSEKEKSQNESIELHLLQVSNSVQGGGDRSRRLNKFFMVARVLV